MSKVKVLTGITPSGTPHLGNYVGAIRPAIAESQRTDIDSYLFMADLHALIKTRDPERIHRSSLEIAATWLACGLDTDRVTFYRQSDIPEISELSWIISCMTAKGLMNRAHAYKAAVQTNEEDGASDPDKGVTMGLFGYPVLMAADILAFNANRVPVGRDQIQHIEMARDVAGRMNHHYGKLFTQPEAQVGETTAILNGLDGRKMSKSYDNVIPMFCPEKKLLKLIRKIKTNSLEPGEPKDPAGCTLFQIFSAFADAAEIEDKRLQYQDGAGWGQLKNELFEYVNDHVKGMRVRYDELMLDPGFIEAELKKGAEKAREDASQLLSKVRHAVGIRPLA